MSIREIMLIIHFIGLAMGVGTSFAFMFLGIASSKMPIEERTPFMLRALFIGNMGHIGLGLSILTGLHLMSPFWSSLADRPLLLAKLILVVILSALIGIIASNARKAKKRNAEMHLAKIKTIGQFSFLTGLAIVVLAVMSFK
ncbi:MAG: hypothetical protein KDC92_10150 [Bacteroidetes bacterium]|nr:hypothetical protein [Bacteroidota bacterium]